MNGNVARSVWCSAMLAAAPAALLCGCGGPVDEQAAAAFKQSIGHTSVTVLPAFVREGRQARYDLPAAAELGKALEDIGVGRVVVSQAEVPIHGEWRMNEARMFRESAADLASYVAANAIQTEYAVLPEYLIGDRAVGGVHVYVVDATGHLAYGILLNSHHPAFKQVNPKSVADCTQLLIQVLRSEWERNVP